MAGTQSHTKRKQVIKISKVRRLVAGSLLTASALTCIVPLWGQNNIQTAKAAQEGQYIYSRVFTDLKKNLEKEKRKELKEKEGSKVEEISWNISNRMRELGNTSVYGGFCLSYVAYLSLKNKINDVYQLVEYVELTFSPERVSFIKGNIENL